MTPLAVHRNRSEDRAAELISAQIRRNARGLDDMEKHLRSAAVRGLSLEPPVIQDIRENVGVTNTLLDFVAHSKFRSADEAKLLLSKSYSVLELLNEVERTGVL